MAWTAVQNRLHVALQQLRLAGHVESVDGVWRLKASARPNQACSNNSGFTLFL
jgi:hypothetical protein